MMVMMMMLKIDKNKIGDDLDDYSDDGTDLRQVAAPLPAPLVGRVPAHVARGHAVTRVLVSPGGPRVIRTRV